MLTNMNTRSTRPPAKRQLPYVIFGSGIFLLVIILIFFFPLTGKINDDPYVQELENRIVILEKQMVELSPVLERLKLNTTSESQIDRLNTMCQRLEASLTLKSNLLAGRMDSLENKIREIKTETRSLQVKTPIPKAEVKKEIQPPKKSPVYHVVVKGDTFYSISKRYGMTLKRLKDLNKFNEKTTIYPGQKIMISP